MTTERYHRQSRHQRRDHLPQRGAQAREGNRTRLILIQTSDLLSEKRPCPRRRSRQRRHRPSLDRPPFPRLSPVRSPCPPAKPPACRQQETVRSMMIRESLGPTRHRVIRRQPRPWPRRRARPISRQPGRIVVEPRVFSSVGSCRFRHRVRSRTPEHRKATAERRHRESTDSDCMPHLPRREDTGRASGRWRAGWPKPECTRASPGGSLPPLGARRERPPNLAEGAGNLPEGCGRRSAGREPAWERPRGRTITPFPSGRPGLEARSVAGEGSSGEPRLPRPELRGSPGNGRSGAVSAYLWAPGSPRIDDLGSPRGMGRVRIAFEHSFGEGTRGSRSEPQWPTGFPARAARSRLTRFACPPAFRRRETRHPNAGPIPSPLSARETQTTSDTINPKNHLSVKAGQVHLGFQSSTRGRFFKTSKKRRQRVRESRHSDPVFPLSRHGPAGSSTTAGNADRAVL